MLNFCEHVVSTTYMLRFAAGNVVIEWDIESTQSDCEPANGMLYKLKEIYFKCVGDLKRYFNGWEIWKFLNVLINWNLFFNIWEILLRFSTCSKNAAIKTSSKGWLGWKV